MEKPFCLGMMSVRVLRPFNQFSFDYHGSDRQRRIVLRRGHRATRSRVTICVEIYFKGFPTAPESHLFNGDFMPRDIWQELRGGPAKRIEKTGPR